MNRHADRPNPLHKGALLVALCAAALLVLVGGCGQFNDNPGAATMSARFQFEGSSQTASTSGPMAITGPTLAGPVQAVVIGAIVITHNNGTNCGLAICPYTLVSQVTPANRDLLQNDAEQSAQYLSLVTLPFPSDTVEFTIPPAGAGFWQLVAIGLKVNRTAIADVTSADPTWYGFTPFFLNGLVVPGQTVATTLILNPWCSSNGGPVGTVGGGTIDGTGTSCGP